VPAVNPVHRQVEALSDSLNAAPSPAEAMILGGSDAPAVETSLPEPEPVPVAHRAMREEIVPVRPAEPERRSWGLFRSRKKEEPRHEPAPRPQVSRPAVQPRAMAQAEPPRPQQQQPQTPQPARGDDLFPDHKRDEQFEIPAFLRRQTN
jgi:cell division protein FtsZ